MGNKKTIVLLIAMSIGFSLCAEDYFSVKVDCSTAGTLSTLISEEQESAMSELIVSGNINDTDLRFVDRIINRGKLKVIDLSDASYPGSSPSFYFSMPIRSEDGNSIVGYDKVDRISMPKTENFSLSIGANSFIDTICINSKHIYHAYGNKSNYSNPASYAIKKVILNEGVESLKKQSFIKDDSSQKNYYIVDEFPTTLREIERIAVYSSRGYIDGEPLESGYIVNPILILSEGLETVGFPDLTSDQGEIKNSWTTEKMFIKESTVKLPSSMKSLNGYMYNSGFYYNRWEYYATEIQCDTLIIPKGMEFLDIKATADVVISYVNSPDFLHGEITTNSLVELNF